MKKIIVSALLLAMVLPSVDAKDKKKEIEEG